jgi:SRSO17 transposase
VGVAKGTFQALLDADLFLPEVWDQDRPRCREAGIPDVVRYRPKWQIAYDQLVRLDERGVRFDWLVFDEGYGSKVPFLSALSLVGQNFVGEVPVSFSVRTGGRNESRRADAVLSVNDAKRGRQFRVSRRTVADARWRATSVPVEAGGCEWTLIAAINETTAEVKYFVTNATSEPLSRVLAVAFRRATIEHSFRVAKSEAGLTHYEGRQWLGLVRHLVLSLVVLGFVSIHTDRLRGEKPACDDGAGVPGVERAVRDDVPAATWSRGTTARRERDPLPPKAEPTGHEVAQETAA